MQKHPILAYYIPWWILNLYPDADTLLIIGGVEQNPGPANSNQKNLTISHVNINSVTSPHRLDELSDFADSSRTDILMLTETKLDNTVHPRLYKLHNYHEPYLKNRSRHGGGVAMYLNASLAAKRLPELEIGNTEWIWALIKVKSHSIIACCTYIPPNSSQERLDDFLDSLAESVALAQSFNPTIILIFGDFNAGNNYLTAKYKNHSGISPFDRQLNDMTSSLDLSQLIDQPTRPNINTANLRDLIFVSNMDLVTDKGVASPFSQIDHYPV